MHYYRTGRISTRRFLGSIALGALLFAPPAWSREQDIVDLPALEGLAVGVGLEYEEGDYGTGDTTELWRVPFSISYSGEDWFLSATLPYLSADSDGDLVVRSGGHHNLVSSAGGRSESGFGDVTLSATAYLPYSSQRDMEPFIRGSIKLGTADEDKGLGTGENDYAIEMGLNKWSQANRYYGALGYEVVGDPPGVNYDNVFYAYGGVSRKLNERQRIGVDLYYSQASARGFDDTLEATGLVSQRLDRQRTLQAYLLVGLSDGSPDWGGGVALKWYLAPRQAAAR